jgi:hypothetical protein
MAKRKRPSKNLITSYSNNDLRNKIKARKKDPLTTLLDIIDGEYILVSELNNATGQYEDVPKRASIGERITASKVLLNKILPDLKSIDHNVEQKVQVQVLALTDEELLAIASKNSTSTNTSKSLPTSRYGKLRPIRPRKAVEAELVEEQ